MYLKSLKMAGFKSFADRTRLELRPGVTVVVGPNGSGKSNIVDAVAWVMGTQSPKSLRTDKMEDVIFAGTATRPGLGRAEVTLVLDNSDGALPLDLAEVSITRRLYRDGSSDYEINGVACRLLDIQELLSDSHVGRHQHVIIGQGQIDSVLNAGPEDHRAVIEEAAGILKHRLRKDKAVRRLERTDGDVLRLRDLLGELARQMRPLKRQAEAAGRHAEVENLARGLRLYLDGVELRRIGERRRQIAVDQAERLKVIDTVEGEAATVAAEMARLRAAAGEVGEALDRDAAAAASLETTIERLRRIAQVSAERHRSGLARMEGADERRRDLEQEAEELEGSFDTLRARRADIETMTETAERRFREAEAEERSLSDQEGLGTEGAIAVARADLRAIESADERDRREESSTRRRVEAIEGQLQAESVQIDALRQEIRDIDGITGSAQRRYAEAEAVRKARQDEWEVAEAGHRRAELAHTAAGARVAALEAAVAGLSDPEVRRGLERAEGAMGAIGRRLAVPDSLAGAVDASLGVFAEAVTFENRSSLRTAVAATKGTGRGGVTAVSVEVDDQSPPAVAVARQWGLEALVDLLGPDADRRLACSLLGDVVVVEGWNAGWKLIESHPELRAVTPEGDLITSRGVRVAPPNGATPVMLENALAEAEAAETELARAVSRLSISRKDFDQARLYERDTLETLESLEAQLAGATEAMGRLERSRAGLDEEHRRLLERVEMLVGSMDERATRRRDLEERLAALEGEEAERQRMWEELTRRRREASARRESRRAEWQDAVSELTALNERITMAERRRAEVGKALDAERSLIVDPVSLDRLAGISAAARQGLEVSRGHLDGLRRRQAELRSRAGETGAAMGRVQERLDQLSVMATEAKETIAEQKIEAAELRVRGEAIAEALRRDLDLDEGDALAAPRPDVEGEDLPGELASRQAELRRMGPINPLAAAEYAELEERHDFLQTQLDDLEKSRDELRKVITALDAEIESQFVAAFDEISSAFSEHFYILFPGGTGRLRLTDPEQPMTAGVEIEAQPLGKKVAKMSLLSGGERSLAALAFLFAVFKARPSPFYLLDEVEAALDDANLRRFLRLLDGFRANAQLVVVTHQQQTMESGDVLYGVTMEPGGSSKVVAKSLVEVEQTTAV